MKITEIYKCNVKSKRELSLFLSRMGSSINHHETKFPLTNQPENANECCDLRRLTQAG